MSVVVGTLLKVILLTRKFYQYYQPVVKFTYEVEGKTFKSNRIMFGEVSSLYGNLPIEIVQKYPEGKNVIVFYNPYKPQEAVLETGLTKKSFIPFARGYLVFTFCGGVGILFWLFE